MAKLKEKKGKTLAQWVDILKKSGPASEKERREWLKSAHGFTTNYAWFVAERAGGNGGRDLSGTCSRTSRRRTVRASIWGWRYGTRSRSAA